MTLPDASHPRLLRRTCALLASATLQFADCIAYLSSGTRLSRSVFYQHLRPEFLRKYSRPLSSDVFTKWGTIDRREHNLEVREATAFLFGVIIPAFARKAETDSEIFGYEAAASISERDSSY